jgi:transposase-like protein
MENGTEVKRWTAKRKRQVVLDILKGKATVAEVARQHDLTPSQVEGWIEEGLAAMENGLRARPRDIREQYEQRLKEAYAALGEAQLEIKALKKLQRLLDSGEQP